MPRRHSSKSNPLESIGAFLRKPLVQFLTLLIAAVIIYLIAVSGTGGGGLAREISVDEAYQLYQQGAFFLDVREPSEWDEYHAPNTTLIPLGQLSSRLSEVPQDKTIVVICRSGNRSQQGRDILLSAGFTEATSMAGGVKEWYAKGYPIEGAPPQ